MPAIAPEPAGPGPLRVAVFGSDERVCDLAWLSNASLEISCHPGSGAEAKRLTTLLHQRRLTHLVMLTQWVAHSSYRAVKAAARKAGVQVLHWPRGIGALRAGLHELLGVHASSAQTVDATPHRYEEPMTPPHALRQAPAERALATAEPPDAALPPTREKKPSATASFRVSQAQVLEAMALEPARSWTAREVAELLGAKSRADFARVHTVVTALLARGTLALVTAGAGHRHEPRRVRLVQDEAQSLTPGHGRRAQHPQPSRWALPPRPAQGPLWLVVCASGTVALVTQQQDEFATALLAEPGRRLFREVRTRLRVEFED